MRRYARCRLFHHACAPCAAPGRLLRRRVSAAQRQQRDMLSFAATPPRCAYSARADAAAARAAALRDCLRRASCRWLRRHAAPRQRDMLAHIDYSPAARAAAAMSKTRAHALCRFTAYAARDERA